MTWRTHWVIGLNSLWLLTPVLPYIPQDELGLLIVAASLGSLLPDLDASESKIKHMKSGGIKPFHLPARVVHCTDIHCGMLHSLVGLSFIGTVALPAAIAVGWLPWAALLLGYASHLLADAATKSGILLKFPSKRRYYALPVGLRLSTGSQAEEALFAICALCAVSLLINRPTV